ncbi:MAG TPA: Uma2 family endonuclease [Byssovorax sp.]|jgi:Uma2 family endonuclease
MTLSVPSRRFASDAGPDRAPASRSDGGAATDAPITPAEARRRHSLIVGNLVGELRAALRDLPCEVHPSEMRVHVPALGRSVVPDVTVLIQAPRLHDEAEGSLANPAVLFEVLTEATEAYDRGDKFEAYASIPSLAEYLLVSTKHARIERFVRQQDGSWTYRAYKRGDPIPLSTCGCQLLVDEVYLKALGQGSKSP